MISRSFIGGHLGWRGGLANLEPAILMTLSKNTDSFTTSSFFHTVLQGWQKRVILRKDFSSHKVALMASQIGAMSKRNLYLRTIGKWTTKTLSLMLRTRQKGCSALTTRTSIKKSQLAVLKKRLRQTRRKRRKGIP